MYAYIGELFHPASGQQFEAFIDDENVSLGRYSEQLIALKNSAKVSKCLKKKKSPRECGPV